LKKVSFRNSLRKTMSIREVGVIVPLIFATILFAANSKVFLTPANLMNVFRNASFVYITAIGMTFLIISGAFDLSVGSVYAFAGVLAGTLMTSGLSVLLSMFIATAVSGLVFGGINGFFVQRIGLPPLLATLGTMNIARGVVTGIRKGIPVYPLPDKFEMIGQGSLFKGSFIEIPFVVLIAIGLGIIASFVLRKTVYGRMVCAVGGNIETARLAGIPTKRIAFSVYILVSTLASFSGILIASRLGSAQPNVGIGYELQAIASVVIGGTSLAGGAGTILGTFLGSLFMAMISNGMTLIKVSPFWQQLVLGIVLLIACSLDNLRDFLRR
jgi:ribose/xylose/arabinose/galactoside ABC-type transport system permease subunit